MRYTRNHFLRSLFTAKGSFRYWGWLAGLALLVFTSGSFYLTGKVVKVADGDSFSMAVNETSLQTMRLYGIDAPELHQKFGKEAKTFCENLILYEPLTTTRMDTDRYGREVVIASLPDGRVVNEELIKHGMAMVYPQHCTAAICTYWMQLEAKARADKTGLWAQKKITPPWKWRARKQNK